MKTLIALVESIAAMVIVTVAVRLLGADVSRNFYLGVGVGGVFGFFVRMFIERYEHR